jgi:hypothetical protein
MLQYSVNKSLETDTVCWPFGAPVRQCDEGCVGIGVAEERQSCVDPHSGINVPIRSIKIDDC